MRASVCTFAAVLAALTALTGAIPTPGNVDCPKYKNEYAHSHIGAFRALAEADIAVESEPMTISKEDFNTTGKQTVPVSVACLLKGRPSADVLEVRLLHNGTRCVDGETLGSVTTNNPNSRFVLALSRRSWPAETGWDLLDGGLFAADNFYKLFDRSRCSATSIYNGTCPVRGSGFSGCPVFKPIVENMQGVQTKLPYFSLSASTGQTQEPLQPPTPAPQPQEKPSESPTNAQQQSQQQQDQQRQQQNADAAVMLASDQPAATAAKTRSDSGDDRDSNSKSNSASVLLLNGQPKVGLAVLVLALLLV